MDLVGEIGCQRHRRARQLDVFRQAKDVEPAIVFIDELDAIAQVRGPSGLSGGNDEREQTLNQILSEMDGFDSSASVVVVATNRPEVLDPALLRAGRFDRRVAVPAPTLEERRAIVELHAQRLAVDDDVDFDRIAADTPGLVGAELANLCNEAALLAARRGENRVHFADFTEALDKVLLGGRRTIVLSLDDRRRTSYHEAGHAIVAMLTPAADPVRTISIIPRAGALGMTFATPETDRVSHNTAYLNAKIRVALGGRVAESLVFGDATTGSESDLRELTETARRMVGCWGMSDAIGAVAVLAPDPNGTRRPKRRSARSIMRCDGSWTTPSRRYTICWHITAPPSTRSPRHCSRRKPSMLLPPIVPLG